MLNHKSLEPQAVRKQLLQFLAAPAPENEALIEADTDLLESGIVDSFRIVAIALFLEQTFGVDVDFDEIREHDFATLSALTDLVLKLGA